MTIQLRTLRVEADMDATKYVAGMNAKVAADKAGAASSAQVGAAVKTTDQKVSTAGNGLERLSRQVIQGYDAGQRFEQGLRTLQRALDTGNVTAERAEQILIGLHGKYGLMANAEQLAANGQVLLAGAVTRANTALALQEKQADETGNAMRRLNGANDNWRRQNLRFQLFDIAQTGWDAPLRTLMQQGPQIVQMYAGQGGVKAALSDVTAEATGMGRALMRLGPIGAVVAATLGAGLLAIQSEVNATGEVTASFGQIFVATMQVAGNAIYSILQPAIDAIAPWFSAAWDAVLAGVRASFNAIVNGIRSSVATIGAMAAMIPPAFIAAGEALANGFVAAIEWMVQKGLEGVKKLVDGANAAVDSLGGDLLREKLGWDLTIPNIGTDFKLGRFDFGGADAVKDLNAELESLGAKLREIAGSDPWDDMVKTIRGQVIKNLKDVKKEADGAGGAVKSAADRGADAWEGMRKASQRAKDELNGIEERAKTLKDAWSEFGRGATDLLTGLVTGTMTWREALSQAIPLVLQLIAALAKAGMFGGASGFVSAVLGGMGFADGGYTGAGGRNTPAGIVHKGEVVWSQRDVARAGGVGVVEGMRVRGYAQGGIVGGPANNNAPSAANQNVHVSVGVSVDDDGKIQAYVSKVEERSAESLRQYDKGIPDKIAAYERAPRRRVS